MVISDEWSSYKEDNVDRAQFMKTKVDYTLTFTSPVYDVLKKTNMNIVSPNLVYEMWDSMIKNVRKMGFTHGQPNGINRIGQVIVVTRCMTERLRVDGRTVRGEGLCPQPGRLCSQLIPYKKEPNNNNLFFFVITATCYRWCYFFPPLANDDTTAYHRHSPPLAISL
ncbi:hypothetical protein V8G54_018402 [Vigna mungo]|uniref:Uncharacterized protein n=1 Tax=Vigna mungo TaxID=3915 RepID=A0AAQ3RUP6_VIGMU